MKSATITTSGRLHFGLFGWGPQAFRQFGGFGLMIQKPGYIIQAKYAKTDFLEAGMEDQQAINKMLPDIREYFKQKGFMLPPLSIKVHHCIPAHHGLGSGTQRALAIGKLMAAMAGWNHPTIHEIAMATNRFPRSSVGAYGFEKGGLIVDGGHETGLGRHQKIAPLISQMQWPEQWRVILFIPQETQGHFGTKEMEAFVKLPSPEVNEMNSVARSILTQFLPALAETDFHRAMAALETIQRQVGEWFAPAQSGSVYGSPLRDNLIQELKSHGLRGVGQSSWGPTLFGFSQASDQEIQNLSKAITNQFPQIQLQCIVTEASSQGHRLETMA
ncbi:MAG: hypothetical protein DWI24_03910 [Planctomycetota bacterium]|nr:MAG: hypothetical protein DWI24_03910 [Planctomycetota bacterium]